MKLGPLPTVIFSSHWLQLPLYRGLVLAQAMYVYRFLIEFIHLAFVVSAIAVAFVDRLMENASPAKPAARHGA